MAMRLRILQVLAVCCVLIIIRESDIAAAQLTADFYSTSCPSVKSIVRSSMRAAVQQDARMAASILRLFFHDCFVQGCDGSVLLDDTTTMQGEKNAFPNVNSLRGFEVVDTIKANVESTCPGVVSCADILALASRDGVVLSGGPNWNVLLGRRDSTTASYSQANENLPGPFEDINALTKKFEAQGLSAQDLVTLSGAHTIGQARCTNFRERLYNEDESATINPAYLSQLQSICPSNGSDDNLEPLDVRTSTRFDTCYYTNLINNRGLLTSDQELFSSNESSITPLVEAYSQNIQSFFINFSTSMVTMGNLNPLTGMSGQIRTNCHVVNG